MAERITYFGEPTKEGIYPVYVAKSVKDDKFLVGWFGPLTGKLGIVEGLERFSEQIIRDVEALLNTTSE